MECIDEAPAVSSRMMSLFQSPPTVHFALFDGTPNDIKGVWLKICGSMFQCMVTQQQLITSGIVNSVLVLVDHLLILIYMYLLTGNRDKSCSRQCQMYLTNLLGLQ